MKKLAIVGAGAAGGFCAAAPKSRGGFLRGGSEKKPEP
ncbi:unknown [Coraliomargarita sp. CAG:312]|nr:unknown [Coraliomargarita sp. CAG:312]